MRRPLWTVVALLAVAALFLWVGSLRGGGAGQSALAVLALAMIAGALATAGLVRRALGALVVTVSAITVAASISGGDGGDGGALPVALGLVAAAAMVAAGVVLVARGHLLPRMGARYQRQPGAAGPRGRRERDLWDELDAGRDPTG